MWNTLSSQHPDLYAWVVIPAFIFAARTADMSLSTLRIVLVAQGRTGPTAFVGFCEALLWLVVIAQVLQHLTNPLCVVAYAAGFAAGNVVGLRIEHRLAMGMRIVRIISPGETRRLVAELRGADFGVTEVDGEGSKGPVKILFTLVRRRDLERVLDLVRRWNPKAFFSVEDVRQATSEVFPLSARRSRGLKLRRALRKSR